MHIHSDFLFLTILYGYDYLYILWAQLDTYIAGKVQVSSSLLFLVNSRGMRGAGRQGSVQSHSHRCLTQAGLGVRKLVPQQLILMNSSRLEGACSFE